MRIKRKQLQILTRRFLTLLHLSASMNETRQKLKREPRTVRAYRLANGCQRTFPLRRVHSVIFKTVGARGNKTSQNLKIRTCKSSLIEQKQNDKK